jgi:ABC-type dipeptide/oligopeptide/nickel transport system permease component
MMIAVVFAVITFTFFMGALVPGDIAQLIAGLEASEQDVQLIRDKYGLDEPLVVQYVDYLVRLVQGDLGRSIRTKRLVSDEVLSRYPATMQLAVTSTLLSFLFAIVLGSWAAIHFNGPIDTGTMFGALIGVSMPAFWRGLMLMLVFSLFLGWLPASGRGVPMSLDGLKHLVLPVCTLTMGGAATLTRLTRSSMLEVLSQNYIVTARGKGLSCLRVNYQHALRNALLPVVTMAGVQFGALLGGTVVIENVFAWPGLGRLMIESILSKDFPVVQGAVLIFAISLAVVNLAIDLSYVALDPRIRYR